VNFSLQDRKAISAGILASCSSAIQAVGDRSFDIVDTTLIICSGLVAWAITWSVGNSKTDTSDTTYAGFDRK
jgi:hypothetical protein